MMKNVLTGKKTLLLLALTAAFVVPTWAQSDKEQAQKAEEIIDTKVLNATETQQFLREITEDLALEGYQVDFGKTLPKVTVKLPKDFSELEEKADKPMTDEEKKHFFSQLQSELSESGIDVDFGETLPNIKRVEPKMLPEFDKDNVGFDRLEDDFAENMDDEALLLELLMSRYQHRNQPMVVGDDVTEELLEILLEDDDF